uniref:Uncharacterized protein n=1 Tax=viral metagenome TaxID=1070528 RepID=A0A6M3LCI9_9ZZZZ
MENIGTARITCDNTLTLEEFKHIEQLIDDGVITGINEEKLNDYLTNLFCKSIKVEMIKGE